MHTILHYKDRQLRAEQQLLQLTERALQLQRDRQLHEQDYLNYESTEVCLGGGGMHAMRCRRQAAFTAHTPGSHDPHPPHRSQQVAELQRSMTAANCEVQQLKLEVLRWRKQYSLMRLKFASADESCSLLRRNNDLLVRRETQLAAEGAGLRERLAALQDEVAAVHVVNAAVETDAAKLQEEAGAVGEELQQLREQLWAESALVTIEATRKQVGWAQVRGLASTLGQQDPSKNLLANRPHAPQ